MKIRKTGIYILTALLLMAAVFWAGQESESGAPFSFLAGEEEIRLWEQEEGRYLVFLPSYASMEDLHLRSPGPLQFDDIRLENGMSCGSLSLDRAYGLPDGKTVTFLKSENLPAMYINTASGSMDYIHEKKGHTEGGTLRLYTAEGSLSFRGSLESLSGHGNSTFIGSEKKPYSLKLTADGDLLGMGAAEKWVLLANCYDLSHMKNKLVFDFAREAGLPYTPDSRWVDLYLNGEYAGIYLLSERNEIHPERVALENSRGFLVSKDKLDRMEQQNIRHFVTEGGVPLRIHQTTLTEEEMTSILQSADSAILAPDGIDTRTGKHWSELIDLDSWARKYLVEEIFGGGDAGHYSQYFYYEAGGDGKIYAGPVWDYDITMGIDNPENTVPAMFYAHRKNISPWFHALYWDPLFREYVTELYAAEFYPLLQELVEEQIPRQEALLAPAARLNQLRWGGGAHEETVRMQAYLRSRTEFLADVWIEGGEYVEVTAVHPQVLAFYAPIYAVERGGRLPDFPEWKNCDWFVTETDEPYDISQPVYEDISIYSRRRTEDLPPAETARETESRRNWELWIPVLSITLLFAALFAADILRMVRSDRKQYDPAKTR